MNKQLIPSYSNKPKPEASHEDEIEKEIIIPDLLDEKPSEKIILDIQDTKRYFESQSGGVDQVKMTEDVS